jgi:hypothetical protein
LGDRDQVAAGRVQVVQGGRHLLAGLAQAEDQVRLGDQSRGAALGDHPQGAVVGERGPDPLEDPRHGLEVVREHLGRRREDLAEQVWLAREVRNQDLHAGAGAGCMDGADRLGVEPGALIG